MRAIPLSSDHATCETPIVRWEGEEQVACIDALAVEEPMEIRLAGCDVAVTMRTPGDDLDLAAGFLFTEGIIRGAADITSITRCLSDDGGIAENMVNINPSDPALVDPNRWRRNFFATSSCGICGKAQLDAIRQDAPAIAPPNGEERIAVRLLYTLAAELQDHQTVFRQTGGLHAAGLFDLRGHLLALREDVGRHNAVDKVVGHALRRGLLPLSRHVLMVSGRASFEIVQKALMAGIPVVAAVSAPSSLAIDLARSAGMTLVGFLRPEGDRCTGRLNIYAGAGRIVV